MLHIVFLERKNQKRRFFLSKSMPNFNFAKSLSLRLNAVFDGQQVLHDVGQLAGPLLHAEGVVQLFI
jgi:hypothetical protein